ncbi:MAG: hypothetical protein U0939_02380 [Pirellulales bacterium]
MASDSRNTTSPVGAAADPESEALRIAATQRHRNQGYTLGALFLLVTVAGALVGYALPLGKVLGRDPTPWQDIILSSVLVGLFTFLVGGMIGLAQRRPVAGLFIGGPIGAIIGLIIGPLTLVPLEQFGEFLRLSLMGSVVIIIMAAVLRRL